MSRYTRIDKLSKAAVVVAALLAIVSNAAGSSFAGDALVGLLAALGVRIGVLAWGAIRGVSSWMRLLLPAIVGLEIASHGASWQARAATVVVLEVAFVVVAIRELRRSAAGAEPLEDRIARAFGTLVPPKLARLAAFEIVIVGAAARLFAGGWQRAVPAGFSYHRESGLRTFLPVLPLLAIGDVALLHFVILRSAPVWLQVLVHALAVYGLVWIVGLYATMRERPHRLVDGRLHLHRGLLRRLAVDVGQIASVADLPAFSDDWKKSAYCKGASRLDIAGATILELHLREPVRPVGVLGEGPARARVLVSVDDPAALRDAIYRASA